ncbi:bifunctional diguanylate cyclase/phosphodiesterase [Bilophila wadsworthia]
MLTIIPTNLFTDSANDFMIQPDIFSIIGILLVLLAFFILKKNANREKLTFSDKITGGFNNIEFQMRYRKLCKEQDTCQYVIILLDVNDFKEINEIFGVLKGNQLLKYCYQVIEKHLKKDSFEFATRSEMDHFFLCLRERNTQIIQRRIDEIIDEINTFKDTNAHQYKILFKQGGCVIEDKNTEITTLQDQVRTIVKIRAVESTTKCVFFNSSIAERIYWEREVYREFETSIQHKDFQLYLQPKVNLEHQKVVGGEALVRWLHPKKGLVSPIDFIPILEKNGKIQKLDQYIFEQTCIWLNKRQREGKPLFPISVNLSRKHFVHEDFLEVFVELAEEYHIDKELIEFELTESIFLNDEALQKVKMGIKKIHEYGFRSSIDDFGFGYSSLSLLCEFDIDSLKIDRSFFMNLNNIKNRHIIKCIMELAIQLNIHPVVEGIETQEQIDYLETLPCHSVQGYFFSKPLAVAEFELWVDKFENGSSSSNAS